MANVKEYHLKKLDHNHQHRLVTVENTNSRVTNIVNEKGEPKKRNRMIPVHHRVKLKWGDASNRTQRSHVMQMSSKTSGAKKNFSLLLSVI